ncbi:MAG: bifunctional adenosylcobinamide kinase/adenosylcobinamide-phosphate guanylyltransferase [Firmicutes bacterium]|nr:bifunctional adenosylcobinamide kinase/adenosylcobinamide-phosphate guanylyltransferase [Bacillota bacterium]
MIVMVYGGSGSGKSKYAEEYIQKLEPNKKYYVATMQVYSQEGKERVKKHRLQREGKGFETIEQTQNIAQLDLKNESVLIECMSNLVANEMFQETMIDKETVIHKMISDLDSLLPTLKHAVIVTNNIFEDGIEYDKDTLDYMYALSKINQYIARISDEVVEVVVGIPLLLKGGRE